MVKELLCPCSAQTPPEGTDWDQMELEGTQTGRYGLVEGDLTVQKGKLIALKAPGGATGA